MALLSHTRTHTHTHTRTQKRHEKGSLFNLNDDDGEGLTHLGRSLAEIDDFDDADMRLSDDEGGACSFFSSLSLALSLSVKAY